MKKKNIKQVLAIAGTAAASIIAGVILSKLKSEDINSEDNDIDEYINNDEHPTKSYNGYTPWGCQCCGGPYPLCRDGCSAFDD